MLNGLAWLGLHGRYCLIAGLLAGLALPDLAQALRPWIGTLVLLLLVVTGIRVGARAAVGGLDDIWRSLFAIGILQVLMPILALVGFSAMGILQWPIALAVVLMLSAPSVTGAPNFAIMANQDPAQGMRFLVLGTLLFPATALPAFLILDLTSSSAESASLLALKLLGSILGAVGIGFTVRAVFPTLGSAYKSNVLDGIAATLLGAAVVALMSEVGPLLRTDPLTLAGWIIVVTGINFGLVATTFLALRNKGKSLPIATAIYAGNRNIALFLIVLPESVYTPLLIFIGCYQIPMYLTPFLVVRLARLNRA